MKVNLTIPDNLNEISLKQYQVWCSVSKDQEDSLFLRQKMISIFCGIQLGHVAQIKKYQIDEVIDHLNALLTGEAVYSMRFNIRKQEFGMIPILEDMSIGEFEDLQTNVAEWETMHKAMAVLYRPITAANKNKQYEIKKYEGSDEYAHLMEFMPLGVVMGSMVFFYSLAKELVNSTQNSLLQEAVKEILTINNSLVKNGDGTPQTLHSLEETLNELIS